MSAPGKIRVSANDTALAHSLAKKGLGQSSERLRRNVKDIIGARSVKDMIQRLADTYRNQILFLYVRREVGSRAYAEVFFFDTNRAGDLALARAIYDAKLPTLSKVIVDQGAMIIKSHVVARVLQRSLGIGDADAAMKMLRPHLIGMFDFLEEADYQKPMLFRLYGKGGCLAGAVEGGIAVIKTWMPSSRLEGQKKELSEDSEFSFERVEFSSENA